MRPLILWPSLLSLGTFSHRNDFGLGNPPNGFKNGVFEWNIRGGDSYESTERFCSRGERRSCVQTQESFV